MSNLIRMFRQIILILVACFFLGFGVHLLVAAYHLNDPFYFVMTFFSSNLIILISAALLVGFVIRMISPKKESDEHAKK